MKRHSSLQLLQSHPFLISLRGIVRHGDKRGRTLGYPTANMWLHQNVQDGVYVSMTKVRGKWWPSVTFVGAAETFGQQEWKVETYIIGFSQDIYDEWITVRLLQRLRGMKKFPTVEALLKAMQRDVERTKQFFETV